jgi:hypothetical protein
LIKSFKNLLKFIKELFFEPDIESDVEYIKQKIKESGWIQIKENFTDDE